MAAATPATGGYAWSAEKATNGGMSFTGSVPNTALKGVIVSRAGRKPQDQTVVAAGAPPVFAADALYGLDALALLNSGKIELADGKWTITGIAKDAVTATSAQNLLAGPETPGWTVNVSVAPSTRKPPKKLPNPLPVPAAAAADYAFTVTRAGGVTDISGNAPTAAIKAYLVASSGAAAADKVKIVDGAPADFVANAAGGLDALAKLPSGTLIYGAGKWTLKGVSLTADLQSSTSAALAALPAGKDFAAEITLASPIDVCRIKLADLAGAGNVLDFAAGSAQFIKGADARLDTVAAALTACPDTKVNVESSTGSAGGPVANMALSVARAEAIVDALVKRGVAAKRLYAVGYGQTLPAAPAPVKGAKPRLERLAVSIDDSAKI